ncbi:DUF3857 domain-containing protein [Taibaiella lutea]|uniref:DUF3857 domain-containing protein n=1 Tax=Taibaiella lutea TaxID=2608001 RepID=A0A5M6CNC1_9BACT|nr:DUF3857 domain-containing protein [Taibaiella lutea]KAA5536701.1 DUF3857 domain-containing protein [Taibaiella lutea]
MKKILLALTITLISSLAARSQEIPNIKNEAQLIEILKQEKFDIDANAKAVILYKKVETEILNGSFEYYVDFVAKILSDEAASKLSLVDGIIKTRYSVIGKISAETYNLENGAVVKQKIEGEDILRENFTEGIDVYKFNLPSVKKGSVIHYSYKTTRPNWLLVPDYYLQEDYPILYESYDLNLPTYLKYDKLERVDNPLFRAKYKDQLDTCSAGTWVEDLGGRGIHTLWVRRNVPAFKAEPMIASEENYKERIRIQIKSVIINGVERGYGDSWENYAKTFLYGNSDYIGQVFKGNGFLSDKVDELIAGKTTDIMKAQAIYSFVRDSFNIKHTNKDFDLRTIFKDRVGSENQINLLLAAMLRKAGLSSNPVLLNSKPGERLNAYFPDTENANDIIICVQADHKPIYLDASQKHLPFAYVLPNNYNGYAMLIDATSKGIELNPNDITEKSTTIVTLKPGSKPNQLIMKLDARPGNYEAYEFREKMFADTSKIRLAIMESLNKTSSGFTLTDLRVNNLNTPDTALKIHVEATLDLEDNQTIYLNPFFDKFFESNPFSASERTHPIEMDYLDDKSYVFSLELPKGYIVDDYPKSTVYKIDEMGHMTFKSMYAYDTTTNTLNVTNRFQNIESTYPASAYESIRMFYSKIVGEQSQKIAIVKTKEQ